MKILKKILLIIGAVISLFLIIALFLPSETSVERSIEINKPSELVYSQVADFNNWRLWNPWTEMEPSSKNWVTGAPGQPGSEWNWEGEKVGKGTMRLDSAIANKYLKTSLMFKAPMENQALCYWNFEDIGGAKTKVIWSFKGHAEYPIGRVFGALFMDKVLGSQFDQGLKNLKKVSEAK